MAVIETSMATDAELQVNTYNANVGGSLRARSSHVQRAGTILCCVGTELVEGTTAAVVENTIVPAWNALPEVNEVNGDQHMGLIPAEQLDPDMVPQLNIQGIFTATAVTIPPNRTFPVDFRSSAVFLLPLNAVWMTAVLEVPSFLDTTTIQALETALKTVAEVTKAKHLYDYVPDSRVVDDSALTFVSHVRFESTSTE